MLRSNRPRRSAAFAITATLAASLMVGVVSPEVALAETGPSITPEPVKSTPVNAVNPGTRGNDKDEADKASRTGNQERLPNSLPGDSNYSATSLEQSGKWQVSGQTGDFSWSYPIQVPPSAGGLRPSLALSYSSSAVDGLTSASNNQASWIGDGWNLWSGFVERTYGSCAIDLPGNPADNPADMCWKSDNATLSLNGSQTMLIRDDHSGIWKPKSDNGTRVERLYDPNHRNGARNGEHWRVTTTDGTQYLFGVRTDSGATWTVPVFGDDGGEPCHQAGNFAGSVCDQAYRWNLDKVVSPNGDMVLYNYGTEGNHYGLNKNSRAAAYTRGGWLKNIEYGLRADNADIAASGRVVFEEAERCVRDSDCTSAVNFPDVPHDLKCGGGTCPKTWSPSFWTTKRLAKIRTEARYDREWRTVDSWRLRHEFPYPDDHKPALWLAGITHTGHDGGEITLPEVKFEGLRMANRVFRAGDGYAPLIRFRIGAIVSETGAVTTIRYEEPNCVPGVSMPDHPDSNTLRCFPARWAAPASPEREDYFHKYVVRSVTSSDFIGSELSSQTDYEYVGGAAWHYDESEFTPEKDKTWNNFRGFAKVVIRVGNISDDPKTRTKTEQTFYRGMNGDKLRNNGIRPPVYVTGTVLDDNWLQGLVRESITYLGDTGEIVSKNIDEPYVRPDPTAKRGVFHARIVRPGISTTYTTLAAGGSRVTKSENSYEETDPTAMVKSVHDHGDVADPGDDRCTTTTYLRNTERWIMSLPTRVETVSVGCGTTAVFPKNALSDTVSTYDGNGNVTSTKQLVERPAVGDPVYLTTSTVKKIDPHGRPLEVADAEGFTTTTAYTPAVGGPTTEVKVTNAKGYAAVSTLGAGRGQSLKTVDVNNRTTEAAHDALGRVVEMWGPGRARVDDEGTPQDGNVKYTYKISQTEPNVVSTYALGPNGNHIETKAVYDGQLRLRQTQRPTDEGRILTETRYDSHGRAFQTSGPFFNGDKIDDRLWIDSNAQVIPPRTVTEFDGADRPVAQTFKGLTTWKTTTKYGGDRVEVTPPAGGVPTTTIFDARGKVVEKRTAAPGGFDATTFAYQPSGALTQIKDPAGSLWKSEYNLLGRLVSQEDPAKGKQLLEYDKRGLLVKSTDARGVVLTVSYDELGRKREVKEGAAKRAEWTYDTVTGGKGLPASATRWVGNDAYTTAFDSYTMSGQPAGIKQTVPAASKGVDGSYLTTFKYNPDGSLMSTGLPAIGVANTAGALGAETVSHTYDDFGRLKTTKGGVTSNTDYVGDTTYTKFGEPQLLTLGDFGSRTWVTSLYDTDTRRPNRTVVDTETPKPIQADVTTTYDPAGNVLSIVDKVPGGIADSQCFRYDHLRRLSTAWTPADTAGCGPDPAADKLAGPAPYWQSFTYDKVGNRLSDTQHAVSGNTSRTYTYAGAKQKSVTGIAAVDEPTYDNAGNTITRKTSAGARQSLDWDAAGQLVKVAEGDKVTSFLYDAAGERLLREEPSAVTLSLNGQELRVDKATGAKTATRYYGHGGQVVATRSGQKLSRLVTDRQGTVDMAVDVGTELKTVRQRHMPFGAPRGPKAALPGDKNFVGGTTDASAGFITLGARQYDPDTGRFLSVDPIMDPSNSQLLNAYTYSANNPVTFSDPTGLYCDSCNFHSWQDGTPSAHNPHNSGSAPVSSSSSNAIPKYIRAPAKPAKISAKDRRVWQDEVYRQGMSIRQNADTKCSGMFERVSFDCLDAKSQVSDLIKEENTPYQPPSDARRKMADALTETGKLIGCGFNPLVMTACFRPSGTTFAHCAGLSAFAFVGAGGEGCIAVDDRGVGLIGGGKAGPSTQLYASVGVGGKYLKGDIDYQNDNKGQYIDIPGPHGTELNVGLSDGSVSAVGIGVGRDIGKPSKGAPVAAGGGGEGSKSVRLFDIPGGTPTCRYCQNISNTIFGFLR